MGTRHGQVGLRMIETQRARDESFAFYRDADRTDSGVRVRAEVERSGNVKYQLAALKRGTTRLLEEAEDQLDERRAELAALLGAEEARYAQQAALAFETPSARRERLHAELMELRARQEEEHDAYVAAKREQAWRDQCDPLRRQISQALERQVIAERDRQVQAKDTARLAAEAEEEVWAKAGRSELETYLREQAEVRAERRLKIERNKRQWEAEMAAHKAREEAAKAREAEEGRQFRLQGEQARADAERAVAERAAARTQHRQELDRLNQEQQGYRQKERDEEAALDRAHAEAAAAALRKQQEDQLVARAVRARTAAAQSRLLAGQVGRTRAVEDEADAYHQRAKDEADAQEDARRAADAAARRRLMLDAVADRVRTMQLHQEQRDGRVAYKQEERRQLEEVMATDRQLKQEEAEARARRTQTQFQMLASQCALKHELQAAAKARERQEVAQLVQSWRDEEAKIQDALAHPRDLGLEGGRFRGHR